jgi:hypothetical protein
MTAEEDSAARASGCEHGHGTTETKTMSEQKRGTFQEQAERNMEAAALRVARSIQTPGQTKQQTKLIAQGIAKGIALYKKQQSEKARERDKVRKQVLRHRADRAAERSGSEGTEAEKSCTPPAALIAAGTLLAVGAVAHLTRYFAGVSVVVGGFPIPLWWSLPIAALAGGMSGWLLWLAWSGRVATDPRRSGYSHGSSRPPETL